MEREEKRGRKIIFARLVDARLEFSGLGQESWTHENWIFSGRDILTFLCPAVQRRMFPAFCSCCGCCWIPSYTVGITFISGTNMPESTWVWENTSLLTYFTKIRYWPVEIKQNAAYYLFTCGLCLVMLHLLACPSPPPPPVLVCMVKRSLYSL